MFNGTVITTAGQELIAYCIANNLSISLTNMKIGDGVTSSDEESMEDMVSEQLTAVIDKKSCKDGVYILRSTFTNENLPNGFYVREVGIYALDPATNTSILFAYDNAGDTSEVDYFSPGNGKVILKEIFEIAASIGNEASVELSINPTLVFITEEEFEENAAKIDENGKIYASQLPDNIRFITISTETVEELQEGHIHIIYEESEEEEA